jgi:hypothetical protein
VIVVYTSSSPHLVTFAKRSDLSGEETVNTEFLQDLFHLPLSLEAYNEFVKIEDICESASAKIQLGEQDSWIYIWGNNSFSSKQTYNALIGSQPTPQVFSLALGFFLSNEAQNFLLVTLT